MEGIIIKNQSNDYTVRTSNGLYVCKPRGKFRNDKITPLVGDSVIIDDINNYLLEILPRKNSLIRPPIANIDIALIAVSVKEPNFDSNLLDKLLTIISFNNIEPVICLTKLDLLTEEEEMRKEYEPQAIEAIKSRLVLEAIMKAEKIEASEEEIKAKMEEMAKSYGKDVEELSKNENLKNYLAEGIKSEKALEFIVNNAKVTEKKKETKKATSKK